MPARVVFPIPSDRHARAPSAQLLDLLERALHLLLAPHDSDEILHHAGKGGISPKMESLGAVTRMMYARKHFSPAHRAAFGGAIYLRHAARAVYGGAGETGQARRKASREVIATLRGRRPVPFAEITSPVAVAPAAAGLRTLSATSASAAEAVAVDTA